MNKPTLVIMAAGLGSRFGGCKQITPVDDQGHVIIDYSIYDALRAGFERIVCVVKPEMEADFRAAIGDRIARAADLRYAYQTLDRLPEGFAVPAGREKPWGTAHAVRACRNVIDGPFAVINADDFYGAGAFRALYDFLAEPMAESENAMVGYRMRNTVTENGYVARGVCETANGFLTSITERTHIEKRGDHAAYTTDGETFIDLPGDTLVSMNFWGFRKRMMRAFDERFEDFVREILPKNPLKAEYFLPWVADKEMHAGLARVQVLPCEETWYGVTYREDLPRVQAAVADMKAKGVYPKKLWE